MLLEFETAADNGGSPMAWVDRAGKIAWHELMHARDVLEGRWPAFHFMSFGNEPDAVGVMAAIGHLWIDGYLNKSGLPALRTKREAIWDLFRMLVAPDVSQKIDDRIIAAIEGAGGRLDARSTESVLYEAMKELGRLKLDRVESLARAWWGRPMDCWQTVALMASLGFTLPVDCAFSQWLKDQKPLRRLQEAQRVAGAMLPAR